MTRKYAAKNVTGSIELEDTYCTFNVFYMVEPDVENNPVFHITSLQLSIAGVDIQLKGWQQEMIIKYFWPVILSEAQKDLDQQIAHAEEVYQLRNVEL